MSQPPSALTLKEDHGCVSILSDDDALAATGWSGISCVTHVATLVASHVVPKSFPGSFCWIALFQQLDSSLGTLSTSSQNLSLSSLLALVASQLASGSGMHQAGHTDRLRASWVEATGANVERRSLPVTTIAAPHLSRLRRSLCFTSSSRSSDQHCPGAVCNIILVSSTDGSWSYDLLSCSFCERPATSPNKVLPWIVQDLETSLATRASR